jgi:hypothetical protein
MAVKKPPAMAAVGFFSDILFLKDKFFITTKSPLLLHHNPRYPQFLAGFGSQQTEVAPGR